MNSKKAGPLQGITLLSCMTVIVMSPLLLVPVIPQLFEHFHDIPNKMYWVPMLVTIPALCTAFFSPIAGYLGDKYGRRVIIIPSLIAYCVFGTLPLILNDFYLILATRFMLGIMTALVMTMAATMIGDLFDGRERETWLSASSVFTTTAALLFIVIGGYAGRFGWNGPFYFYALPLLLVAAAIFFTWEGNHQEKLKEMGENVVFPTKFVATLASINLVVGILFYAVQLHMPAVLRGFGIIDPGKIGGLTAIASLSVPIGSFIFLYLSKRLTRTNLFIIEFAIMAVSFFMMSISKTSGFYVFSCTLNQIGAGMILPTMIVWTMDGLHFSVRSRGIGIVNGAFSLGQFVCGLVTPAFAAIGGGLLYAFSGIGIISVICLLVSTFYFIKSKKTFA